MLELNVLPMTEISVSDTVHKVMIIKTLVAFRLRDRSFLLQRLSLSLKSLGLEETCVLFDTTREYIATTLVLS
jgi:hypothetical protein